jgi:hypothetical protein
VNVLEYCHGEHDVVRSRRQFLSNLLDRRMRTSTRES